ncbi:MAG: Crp/Fnr family transcriptional regulator [Burkholderiales bacterium]|nr:Crp/Fnr family transcriptional regulator [Burkholderiales bacterium]MBK8665673.1 Crp/Fnr family transcriptional regulator [Burkholderiales bacterium]
MDALRRALAQWLPGLADDALARAAADFAPKRLDKGQPLLRHGDVWRHVLWIERGALRLYFTRSDGREFNKNFFLEGALLCPLTPAMWGEPSLFEIGALEPGVVWRADAASWRARLDAVGAWEPLRTDLLARLVSHKLQREHDLLTLDARRRYAAFCAREPGIAERIALGHLASYLGITDVSLSRIRRHAGAVPDRLNI